jgi:hypothetical protein
MVDGDVKLIVPSAGTRPVRITTGANDWDRDEVVTKVVGPGERPHLVRSARGFHAKQGKPSTHPLTWTFAKGLPTAHRGFGGILRRTAWRAHPRTPRTPSVHSSKDGVSLPRLQWGL